jgi:cell fate (sporulation/competence/biofilm development) regulator YmcA (YheA/YmcA/DUF963 family)
MRVLVLKTNVDNEQKLNTVNSRFDTIPQFKEWSVDQEDIDNVLRIVTTEKIMESDVIDLLDSMNLLCEELAE